jgi:hypothetical protein
MEFGTKIRIVLVILLLAVCVRCVRYMNWPGTCMGPEVDTNEISRIAETIATTGEFANPYSYPTGPTAHHAPVYPFILSFVYRLPATSRITTRVGLNIFFGSALCALVYFAGLGLGMRPSTSLVSALVLAVVPPSLSVELCNDQEATLVGALVVSAILAMAVWFRGPPKFSWALGLFWGLVLLAAPALALVYVGYLVLAATMQDRRGKVAVLVVTTVIVLMPWTIRNRLVLGGWFFIRDNLGLELRVSNADDAVADPWVNAGRGAMQTYHPIFNRTAAERVRREGELAVYSRLGRDAVGWIWTHPSRFLALSLQRFAYFWFPPALRLRMIWRVGSVALATVGLVLLWRRERMSAMVLIVLFAFYPLPYYFLQSYERYRFPIEWAIVLLAVHTLNESWSWFRRSTVSARSSSLLARHRLGHLFQGIGRMEAAGDSPSFRLVP